MKSPRPDPVAISVHDRLLKLATSRKEDFNAILARYGVERLLYRLTRTPHVSRFILKGAAMFVLWLGRVHRPTRDLDLLGSGQIDSDILQAIFTDIAKVYRRREIPAALGMFWGCAYVQIESELGIQCIK